MAIERMVDRFAAEIGMDPAEVRRRNLVPRFLDAVHDRHRHDLRRRRLPRGARAGAAAPPATTSCGPSRQRRRAAGDTVALGIGISVYVEITAGAPGTEFGVGRAARRRPPAGPHRGHAVRPGPRHDLGDDRGRPHRRADRPTIEVVHGDTDLVRSGGLTVGSRSVQLGGAAIADATTKLVDAARERAADLLEAAVDDVVLDDATGRFHVAGTPARDVGWAELAAGPRQRRRRLSPASPTSGRRCRRSRSAPTSPSVEVDTETGHVRAAAGSWPSTTPGASSTRCWPRARCTAASPRAWPRSCWRRSTTTRTASPRPRTSPTTP